MLTKLILLSGCALLTGSSLSAQTPAGAPRQRSVPACDDSTNAMFQARLRIDLEYTGANASEMVNAFEWAVMVAGSCLASRDAQPAADTTVYGQMRITRVDRGGYEIATALAGPRAQRGMCASPRAAVVGGDHPIVLGVVLAHTVRMFVACVQDARAGRPAVMKPE